MTNKSSMLGAFCWVLVALTLAMGALQPIATIA